MIKEKVKQIKKGIRLKVPVEKIILSNKNKKDKHKKDYKNEVY